MVWQKGSLDWQDGAGHVGIVEKILDDNTIYTSESAWGGSAFYNSTRNNNNGRWGMGAAYKFRACIINPAVKALKVTSTVKRNEEKDQVEVLVEDLNVRVDTSTKATRIGYAKLGYYNVLEKVNANNYTWLKIAENQFIAYDEEWEKLLPRKEKEEVKPQPIPTPIPEPTTLKYKVGDQVVISGKLYLSSNAAVAVSSIFGKVTKISRVAPGTKHPYNTTGDLGWMDESSINFYNNTPVNNVIKVGDKVKVLNNITYDGKRFLALFSKYDVIEAKGDRIVIGIGKVVTAAVHKDNLKKV